MVRWLDRPSDHRPCMDLKQLEYFVNVVDLGGFSRARRACSASPSRRSAARCAASRWSCARRCSCATVAARRRPRPASACSTTRAASCSRSSARGARSTRSRARRSATSSSGCRRRSRARSRRRSCASSGGAIRARSLSIVEGLSSHIHEWLVSRPRRRRRPLQPVAFAGGRAASRCSTSSCASSAGARRAAAPRTLRAARPAAATRSSSRAGRTRSGCWSRRASRRSGCSPQVALEIDAVAAILELVAEGPRRTRSCRRARSRAPTSRGSSSRDRSCSRALASTLAIATSAQRPSTPLQHATVDLIEDAARDAIAAR